MAQKKNKAHDWGYLKRLLFASGMKFYFLFSIKIEKRKYFFVALGKNRLLRQPQIMRFVFPY
ncbi:MAG: hypothetical protein IPN20_14800 [Haliscomenobacter sp.]|nr:hypothetical protein [Haliscomenobacter sp.]